MNEWTMNSGSLVSYAVAKVSSLSPSSDEGKRLSAPVETSYLRECARWMKMLAYSRLANALGPSSPSLSLSRFGIHQLLIIQLTSDQTLLSVARHVSLINSYDTVKKRNSL